MYKESHPYLDFFKPTRKCEYLIIGTFPPNKIIRQDKSAFVDYFYGNKGGPFWKIIDVIYPEYNLLNVTKETRIKIIKKWEEDYSIGIVDVLCRTARKKIESFKDEDLIFDASDLNYDLRNYIFNNLDTIKKIIFTSCEGVNSAYSIFKEKVMGKDFKHIPANKIEKDIVSPANSVNTSLFNKPDRETLGLEKGFYNFIIQERLELKKFYDERWRLKITNKELGRNGNIKPSLPKSESGIVIKYKIWSYSLVLPNSTNK